MRLRIGDAVSETIVLPRSGVVLKTVARDGNFEPILWEGPSKARLGHSGAFWIASHMGEAAPTDLGTKLDDAKRRVVDGDGRAKCIDWLDLRVLALRAALLPAGAREVIAKALHDVRQRGERDTPISTEQYRDADAVLRALGVEVTK